MSLGYPSLKYYEWVIQSNKIKDLPVTVQDIGVAHNVWVKSVPYLKVNTTNKKPIHVAGDLLQVLEELMKLHKYIYLMADLFFVNSIPFFLTLIRKI